MIFRTLKQIGYGTRLKGIFGLTIPYEIRVPEGNWTQYFGHYQNQRWGEWDSNSCWKLSQINCYEDQLEWLYKNDKFSPEALTFFMKNGYIDSDGDFSLSERFGEILGGNFINGGTSPQAWDLSIKYGEIPRSMLTYTLEQAAKFTIEQEFEDDYFNPKAITPEMLALGKQFLKYVTVAYKQIGSLWATPDLVSLQVALRQAPINIGIPIPANVSLWNNAYVQYDGSKQLAHEIELYGVDSNGNYLIFDQYQPVCKTLSKDYFIGAAHQGIINAKPIPVVPVVTPEQITGLQLALSKLVQILKSLLQLVHK